MPRLVVKPGSSAAWAIQLRPGENSLGRSATNDFQIADASISGSHCRITVGEEAVLLRDLGSTNGTFLEHTPVIEAVLVSGQTIRLGDVEMVFYADPVESAAVSSDAPESGAVKAAVRGQSWEARAGLASPIARLPATSASGATEALPVGAQYCRFHPKMPARLLCQACQHFFCEACVALRLVGGVPHKFCRHCGAECVPVLMEFAPKVEQGFFARLPGAFLYPVRGVGVLIVLVGIVLVAGLKLGEKAIEYRTIRMIIFGVIMIIFCGGYLFTYLQAIIHSTEAGDRELPDLPGIANFLEDVLVPFGRLLTLGLICFGPAAGLAIWVLATHETALVPAAVAAGSLGYLYFPMAFLAVATLDSLGAANPLLVVPSMLKAPVEYVLALAVLAAVFAVQFFGSLLLANLFPEGWTIHSMGGLGAMVGMMVFLSFLSLYLLIVATHLLGLIFVTKKDRFGWLER